MKQQGAVFAAFAFAWIVRTGWGAPPGRWRRLAARGLPFAAGVLAPVPATVAALGAAGTLGTMWFWTVEYARRYASYTSLAVGASRLETRLGHVGPELWGFGLAALAGVAVLVAPGARRWEREGNVLLRREPYRRADDPAASASMARSVLTAKIANSRTVLLRAGRDHGDKTDAASLDEAGDGLSRILVRLNSASSLDEMRGLEGEAARTYFGAVNHCITTGKEDFFFDERSRRPPLDNMNALLSFLYTLLAHDVAAALEGVGLDPAVGFLHRDRPGRPGLALDIMEEFRPFLADRLALSLVNRRQINGKGFRKTETGSVLMSDETRNEVMNRLRSRPTRTW